MTQIQVRPCTTGDLTALARLSHEWEAEGCTRGLVADSVEDFSSWLDDYLVCAVHESEVVGYGRGVVTTDHLCVVPKGEAYLVLQDLFVAAKYRGQGIGSAILSKMLSVATDAGIEHFTTHTANRDLERTLAFYREHGFEAWSISMVRSRIRPPTHPRRPS